MSRRFVLALALATASIAPIPSLAADAQSLLEAPWSAIERKARGQTVYWSAWGGDPAINRYIGWVAERLDERYGLDVVHGKVDDIATTISRIVAERAAGNPRRVVRSLEVLRRTGRPPSAFGPLPRRYR